MPTPFASLCFTPLDGFLQSLPYHVFVFVFPLHKGVYLASFLAVQLYTIAIHDHAGLLPAWLEPYVIGAAAHSAHHLYFTCNHGLYTTVWDRIGGTFRLPPHEPNATIERMRKEGLIPGRTVKFQDSDEAWEHSSEVHPDQDASVGEKKTE